MRCEFEPFRLNSNKIVNESANLKFEFFEQRKDSLKLIGELDISLLGLFNSKSRKISIYRNNLVVGKLKILELKKDNNNTFFSYVYGDFCIKYMLALDLSSEEQEQEQLSKRMGKGNTQSHFLQAMNNAKGERSRIDLGAKLSSNISSNIFKSKIKQRKGFDETLKNCGLESDSSCHNFEEYADPIAKVSKILGCFEDDYRIPVLGLGARLWPLHCIVSHCFGLNSDIFNPLFDSAEDIHTELRRSLKEKKFLPQGPVIFSEVLSYAREFAKFCKEEDSRYYVVLVIMTNNELSDIEAFKEELKLSCEFPLSVIICRVVPSKKVSSTYETLRTDLIPKDSQSPSEKQEDQKQQVVNKDLQSDLVVYQRISDKLAREQRDILHAFSVGEKQKLELTRTARKVFQKLPKQFVEYMEKVGKKPKLNEEGRGSNGRIKELKKELINKMNNRKKNLDKEKSVINRFLKAQREQFRKRAHQIGFDQEIVARILESGFEEREESSENEGKERVGLAAQDLNLLSELVGYLHNLKNIREKEPIMLNQLKVSTHSKRDFSLGEELKSKVSEQCWKKGVKPKEEIVFTREDNDNINSKWKQRQKDLYSRTQKFLRKLEQREIDFQKQNFPEALFQKLEEGFYKLEEGKLEEREERGNDKDERAEAIYKGVRNQIKDYFVEDHHSEEDSQDIYNSEDEVYIRLDTIKTKKKSGIVFQSSEFSAGENDHFSKDSLKITETGKIYQNPICPMWFLMQNLKKL